MKMKNYVIIAIVIVLVIGGYFVYQTISETPTLEIQPEDQIQPDETTKIYTVDELIESNIQEGIEVFVSGRYNVKLISAGPDYEGPGGGDYLFGETQSIHLTPPLKDVELNSFIKVKGNVRYCGGKKIKRYICGLTDVELIETDENEIILDCIKEGKGMDGRWAAKNNIACCEDLEILPAYGFSEGKCIENSDLFICIDCPNGKCGIGENKCNCPEDCQNE